MQPSVNCLSWRVMLLSQTVLHCLLNQVINWCFKKVYFPVSSTKKWITINFRSFLVLKVTRDCWKTSCWAHRFNHTNLQASLSHFDCCFCPCCYRNRSHCQKWKDDNHLEKKKKLGTQIKIILKALSRILVLFPFYKRDSQKQSTEVKAMLYISGETSNSIFPQLSF